MKEIKLPKISKRALKIFKEYGRQGGLKRGSWYVKLTPEQREEHKIKSNLWRKKYEKV